MSIYPAVNTAPVQSPVTSPLLLGDLEQVTQLLDVLFIIWGQYKGFLSKTRTLLFKREKENPSTTLQTSSSLHVAHVTFSVSSFISFLSQRFPNSSMKGTLTVSANFSVP